MSRPNRSEFRRLRNTDSESKEKTGGAENEIKVQAKRGQRSYITYAIALLSGTDGKTKFDTITVSGMGAAIYNVVNIAEIVKRRVKGVHQVTELLSQKVVDSYENVESKEVKDVERNVPAVLITLSTKRLDVHALGYQEPLPEDQVTEQEDRQPGDSIGSRGEDDNAERPRERGGFRGGRGGFRGGRGSDRGERGADRGGRGFDRVERGTDRGGRGFDRGGRGFDRAERGTDRGGRGSDRGGRGADRGGRGSDRGGRGADRGGRGSDRGGRGSDRGGRGTDRGFGRA